MLSRETADLDSDGFIDALHITFSEAIRDASVEASDFTVTAPAVTALAFNATAGGDTADDEDIYLTFADSVHDTGITPSLAFAQSGATDVEDLAAATNSLAGFGATLTVDRAAPVLLFAIANPNAGADLFNAVGEQLDLVFSESLSAAPGEASLEAALSFAGGATDGDNLPSMAAGTDPISLATTSRTGDTLRIRFDTGNAANSDLLTVGTHTVQVTIGTSITDPTGNSASTVAAAVTIIGDGVNDMPVNTVPGAQSTREDTTLVFASAGGNQISIGDVDAGLGAVEVTLNVTGGTVTLAGIAGLAFTLGDGAADATMTFTGTLVDINAALDGLAFDSASGFLGTASLQISTDDQGNTGSGGAQSDVDTVDIEVTESNGPPVIGDRSFTAQENSSIGTLVGTITASDPNPGDRLTYTIIADSSGGGFTIDSGTGAISVNNDAFLDFDVSPVVVLTIHVVDDATTALSATATVVINLLEVADPIIPDPDPPPPPPEPVPDPEEDPPPDDDDPDAVAESPNSGDDGDDLDTPIPEEPDSPFFVIPTFVEAVVLVLPAAPAITVDDGIETIAESSRDRRDETYTAVVDREGFSDFSIVDENLWTALDFMERELEDARRDEDFFLSFAPGVMKFTGIAGAALIITWILRAGSLLSSLAASMPLWMRFDPLPVVMLSAGEVKRRKAKMREGDEADKKELGSLVEARAVEELDLEAEAPVIEKAEPPQ